MCDQWYPPDDISAALLRYHLLLAPSSDKPPVYLQEGDAKGVLGFARNPLDPGAPLVLMLVTQGRLIPVLMQTALLPGLRYTFIVNSEYRSLLRTNLRDIEYERHCLVYTCDEMRSRRKLDEVSRYEVPGGRFGYIRCINGQKVADARVNWLTEQFAEIGVHTKKEFRGRGYAKDVVAALSVDILTGGRRPVYVVGHKNLASISVCESLGYTLSTYREYECVARYAGNQRRRLRAKGVKHPF